NNGQTAYEWGNFRDYGLASVTHLPDANLVGNAYSFNNLSSSSVNKPDSGAAGLWSVGASNSMGTLGAQLGLEYSTSTGNYKQADLYIRAKSSAGTWHPWLKVYHSGNLRSNA